METPEPPRLETVERRRLMTFLKVAGILVLIALLHIPLALTHGVLQERRSYQTKATEEVSRLWGRSQLISGPVLAVPYVYRATVTKQKLVGERVVPVDEQATFAATAYFLPEVLQVDGKVQPEVRRRGIFETVVYSGQLQLTGEFQPDFAAAGIVYDRIEWEKASVLFGVSDLRGLRSVGPLHAAGRAAAFESTAATPGEFLPLAAPAAGVVAAQKWSFALEVVLQGSERWSVAPLGKSTKVTLQSPWADPSFVGAALPVARQVSEQGFTAEWASTHYSRGYAQAWTSRAQVNEAVKKAVEESAFGVRFARPVDGYGMAERAQKYGVLFFVLVFAVFFLFEVIAGLRIHPLQYALVGAALCLFFLGFLALTEFFPIGVAYGSAAAACTLLIAGYAWSFLRAGGRALAVGGGLGATYGYLFFVLQSEDFALLAGTLALFAMLAAVMFLTRRVNWYAVESKPGAAP